MCHTAQDLQGDSWLPKALQRVLQVGASKAPTMIYQVDDTIIESINSGATNTADVS